MMRETTNYPLSFAQQQLWFVDQLQPSNVAWVLRLSGPLDQSVLQQSLEEIVCRHEILRTTFGWDQDEQLPRQLIRASTSLSLQIWDVRHLPEPEQEEEAQRVAQLQAREPFHLAQGPLLRLGLICLQEREHWLLLNMHHIIIDD